MDSLICATGEEGIDPSFPIVHRCGLEDGPQMYDIFKNKKDGCMRVKIPGTDFL
jgi:hypothetical protein